MLQFDFLYGIMLSIKIAAYLVEQKIPPRKYNYYIINYSTTIKQID